MACWVKRGRHLKLMPVHVPDGLANSDQSENWLISLLIGQAGRANFRYQLRIQLVDAANDCSSATAAGGALSESGLLCAAVDRPLTRNPAVWLLTKTPNSPFRPLCIDIN